MTSPVPQSPRKRFELHEKEELQGLNNRLEIYLHKVRGLQALNDDLEKQLSTIQNNHKAEIQGLRALYEAELKEAHSKFEVLAREKAVWHVEQQKLVQDLDDESKRNAKLVKQVGGLEKEVAALRNELSSRQVDLDRALNELAELRHYKESHSGTVKDLNNDLTKLQRKADGLAVQNGELRTENELLKQKLQFEAEKHSRDAQKWALEVGSHRELKERLEAELKHQYSDQLKLAIDGLRDEADEQLRKYKEELARLHAEKLDALKRQQKSDQALISKLSADNNELNGRVAQLLKENKALITRAADLDSRIRTYEEEVVTIRRVLNETTMSNKRDQDSVTDQLQELQTDYEALEKEKEKLDAEINKYRELLGEGEQRLGLESPAAAAGGPQKKRKRPDPAEVALQLTHHLRARVKTDKGSVGFVAVPESGRLIRLHNEASEPRSLRGWKLTATGANKQAAFAFPDDAVIAADSPLTIHIAGQKGGRTPSRESGSLVWRTSAFWKKGGALVLLDEQERVQSTAELALEEGASALPLTTEESHDGLPAPAGDGADGDQRCIVM